MTDPKRTFPLVLRSSLQAAAVLLGAAVLAGLSGCGAGVSSINVPVQVAVSGGTQGIFMGGQQPVANVGINLYQASTGGYGTAATSLTSTFYTTASGNFTLPSYTCTAGSQIFLVGTKGQPIAGTTNNNLAMMVGLGTCGGSDLGNFINVNELTTVATVYALAPFMSSPTGIGTKSSNTAGLANSFAVINQIVNTTNGAIPGPALPTGATLPVVIINALADALEQCVNSGGGTAGDGSGCGKLFTDTTVNGVAPTDTITAMLNIAKNPTQNVAAINQLRSTSPVFTPAQNSNTPPSAWTLAITYVPASLSAPSAIATDGSGNVWVTSTGTSGVTKLDYTGTQTFSVTTNYSTPSAIAIDPSGNAWITNAANNTLAKQPAAGGSPTIYTGNGLTAPKAVAIDGTGNVFVTNTSSVSSFTNAGAVLNAPYTGVSAPVAAVPTPR